MAILESTETYMPAICLSIIQWSQLVSTYCYCCFLGEFTSHYWYCNLIHFPDVTPLFVQLIIFLYNPLLFRLFSRICIVLHETQHYISYHPVVRDKLFSKGPDIVITLIIIKVQSLKIRQMACCFQLSGFVILYAISKWRKNTFQNLLFTSQKNTKTC